MKGIFKKSLSVILAVLMAVTVVPFTASAAETDEIAALMTEYENKMDGSLYYNMLKAYNAYIDAKKVLDAYSCGEATADQLEDAKTALENALSEMEVWTIPKFTNKAYHCAKDAVNAYSNVVYCNMNTNWSGTNEYNDNYAVIGAQKVKIAMPRVIVFAYDGINDIYGPVVFEHTREDSIHQTNIKWVGADDSDWEFRDYWYGYYDSNNQGYNEWPGKDKLSGNCDSYFGYSKETYKESVTSSISFERFYWNKLYFKGTPDTTDYYTKTYRQTFTMVGWQNLTLNSGNKTGTIYSDNTQYVINYEPALNQLTSTDSYSINQKLAALATDGKIPVQNYLDGGLGNLLGAIDKLVDSRPMNFTYDIDVDRTVKLCASRIKQALSDAEAVTITPDPSHTETPTNEEPKESNVPTDKEANAAPVNKSIKKINKITTVSNIKKKSMNISFSKVSGAENYRVAFRKAGDKNWKYAWTGGKTSYVLKNLKANQLYEFKFAAYKKIDGKWQRGEWSAVSYRYFYKATMSKLTTKKKTITATWKRDKNCSYYVVYYATKKDMSNQKQIKVKGNKTTKCTIKKLKKGKKYYIRVRAYKTKNKKNYAGELSAKKSIKCK